MGLPKVQPVKHAEQKIQINLTESIASKKKKVL